MKTIVKGRGSKVFGAVVFFGMVFGALGMANRSSEERLRNWTRDTLKTARYKGPDELSQLKLGSQVKNTLVGFAKERGPIEAFKLGAVRTIFGVGLGEVEGTVTRRGKPFGFSVVLGGEGQIVGYHESSVPPAL